MIHFESMSASLDMAATSALSQVCFSALVIGLSLLFVVGVARVARAQVGSTSEVKRQTLLAAVGMVALLLISALAARSGLLASWAGKPQLGIYPLASGVLVIALAFSRLGKGFAQHLPIAALVGFQAFRLPLELILHRWYQEGAVPVQMTFVGDNYDIVSGILALIVGSLVHWGRAGYRAILLFNVVATSFLFAVIRVALLSSPVPFRSYTNEPTLLVALYVPYTWIIPICVGGALFGHLVVFRYLWLNRTMLTARALAAANRS
jgi:hypothetical protein